MDKREHGESRTVPSFCQASTAMVLASKRQRVINQLLDFFFIIVMMTILGMALSSLFGIDPMNLADSKLFQLMVGFIYYLSLEALSGRTIGKLITGTKAVTEDGLNLTFGRALQRTLCRFIPFDPFSFLTPDGIPKGWHDRIPKTKVISLRST